jgi:serine/threonine-protein kinase
MVGHDGGVKVVDFGIAASALSRVAAAPGMVRGKAAYMSPEQCLGDPFDRRTDVFALGVVLYELTTGARCFQGGNDLERMVAVVRGEYQLPHEVLADYPRDLEGVVCTALANDPADRFASAAALCEALARVAAAHGWLASASTIARAMHALFGEVPEPWVADLLADHDRDVDTLCDEPPPADTDEHDYRTGRHRLMRRSYQALALAA